MQPLENKGKFAMPLQDQAASTVNGTGTCQDIGTPLTQAGSLDVLRRDLIAKRVRYGADSPIGHRCSNLIELLQVPEIPTYLISRQMRDMEQLLNDAQ